MKKTKFLAMGLVSLVALTACGGKTIDAKTAEEIMKKVEVQAPTTAEKVKDVTIITSVKATQGKETLDTKALIAISLTERYFHIKQEINGKTAAEVMNWYEDGTVYSFSVMDNKLESSKMELPKVDEEISNQIKTAIVENIANISVSAIPLFNIEESDVIADAKQQFGDTIEIAKCNFDKTLKSAGELDLEFALKAEYELSVGEEGKGLAASNTESASLSIKNGLPQSMATYVTSSITVAGTKTDTISSAEVTFDYGSVEVVKPAEY